MDKKIISWILLTFTMIFWGMSFVWTRQLLVFFSPITIISLRLIISTVVLLFFSIAFKRLQRIKKEHLKHFILLSFFQPFLYFVFEGYGIQATSASFAAIFIATIPLFTPIGSYLFLKEKVLPLNIVGLLISFVGVAIIVFDKSSSQHYSIKGILLLLGAVISAVGYLLVLRKAANNYNTFSVATWQNFLGIFFFLPFFLPTCVTEFNNVEISLDIIYPLSALAILASSLAFIFNTYGVRELGATKAAAFTNSVPVFTLIFAYFIIDEQIGIFKLLGILIVIFGLLLSQFSRKNPVGKPGL
ncbi:MAG: DMT family transporter [Salinivirgaceae bacterium]|jgi:drug/metabolite transporter (DMT)-like permease|nr:DMT family transporter [Salinivirgaceae bacterium]